MPSIANRVAARLSSLTTNQVRAMCPIDRQLADQCQRVFALTEMARAEMPRAAGVNGATTAGVELGRATRLLD